MKLFIANLTKQDQEFAYRVPEQPGVRKQLVKIGGQVQISGDLNQKQIDSIIEQHAKYGLIAWDEAGKIKKFAGVCYRVGEPVPVDRIRRGLETNDQVLTDRGIELRKEAALATNEIIDQNGPTGLQKVEMTIKEEPQPGEDVKVDEKITVDKKAEPEKGAKQRKNK